MTGPKQLQLARRRAAGGPVSACQTQAVREERRSGEELRRQSLENLHVTQPTQAAIVAICLQPWGCPQRGAKACSDLKSITMSTGKRLAKRSILGTRFGQISQCGPTFTVLVKYHSFGLTYQFWPTFTLLGRFHNFNQYFQDCRPCCRWSILSSRHTGRKDL